MLRLRRTDHTPRFEVLPLLDVVFLLLTFFIVSQLVMAEVRTLPVDLTRSRTGDIGQSQAYVITLDRAGTAYWNGDEPVELDTLRERLIAVRDAAGDRTPVVYLASAQDTRGDLDRLPTFLEVLSLGHDVGGLDLVIVQDAR